MFSRFTKKKSIKLITLLSMLSLLQGCAAVAVVTLATSVSMATDRRSIGNQIDDQNIELAVYNELTKDNAINNNTRLHITSVNGSALLTGQAPNTYLKDKAIKIVNSIKGIVRIHDQIRIIKVTSITTQTSDAWLTSKIKAALLSSDNVNADVIKVVTENSEVFLMGLVTKKEADIATDIARNIGGVKSVYKAFEYI